MNPLLELLASAAGMLQLASYGFMFLGKKMFGGFQHPWLDKADENKFAVMAGVFLLNNVAQNAVRTGAFEISYGGELLFSKLQTGHLPSDSEIESIVGRLAQRGLDPVAIPTMPPSAPYVGAGQM